MSDRSRTARWTFDPHLGAGDRREDVTYHPKYTHEQLDALIDELSGRKAGAGNAILIIDFGDSPVVTGWSKRNFPLRSATLTEVYGAIATPGATDLVADMAQNGTTVGTITIAAGDTLAVATLSAHFNATDAWQSHVTSAPVGASGLTFFGRFI